MTRRNKNLAIGKQQAKAEIIERIGNRDLYAVVQTWQYALNLMNATSPLAPMAYQICAAFEASADQINLKLPEEWTKDSPRYDRYTRGPRKPVERSHWDAVKATLQHDLSVLEDDNFPPPALVQNMGIMARALELDENSRNTLELLCLRFLDVGCTNFLQGIVSNDQGLLVETMPTLFNRPEARSEMNRIFDMSSPLMKYGFLRNHGSSNGRADIPIFEESLMAKMSTPGLTSDEVVGRILGTTVTSELVLEDFLHLGQKLDFIVRRIKAAVEKHEKGVNILLYGEPGVGKTELAGALAQALGLKLYAIGEDQENPDNRYYGVRVNIGQVRLGELLRAQGLLRKSREAVLMFDEFEDLLIKGEDNTKAADTANKVQLNRTLENNEIPTIWLGNKPWKLEANVKQRFTYSLFMDTPPTLVRDRIWQRRAEMSKVKIAHVKTLALARAYAAPPRMMAQAVETVAATGKMSDLETSLNASILVGSGSEQVKLISPVPAQFSAAMLTAEVAKGRTLSVLIAVGQAEHPFRLLMRGRQGSGASTAVRYLAEQINMNPVEISMEDLRRLTAGPPPEVRIARAFEQAASHNRFLIVNDIEHLLTDPETPANGLHKSIAHAFKKAADGHTLPFASTTEKDSLPDTINILFSDHLVCGPLSPAQTKTAYRHFFGRTAPRTFRGEFYVGDFAEAAGFLKFVESSSVNDSAIVTHVLEIHALRNDKIGTVVKSSTPPAP